MRIALLIGADPKKINDGYGPVVKLFPGEWGFEALGIVDSNVILEVNNFLYIVKGGNGKPQDPTLTHDLKNKLTLTETKYVNIRFASTGSERAISIYAKRHD